MLVKSLLILLSTITVAITPLYAIDDYCAETLRNLLIEIEHFDNKSKHSDALKPYIESAMKRGNGNVIHHNKMKDDFIAYKNIEGERNYTYLNKILPDEISLIDHQTYKSSEDGVVKISNQGEFISVRAHTNFKGKRYDTNIGIPRLALVDNEMREEKSIVTKNAKAVVLFCHGGGTKTTGHHVGAGMMNSFKSRNVDVISLDLPGHGEGVRYPFKDNIEFLEWIRAFTKTHLLKSNVDIYLGGHSMGGDIASMYMREYPEDTLFKGLIALSPPTHLPSKNMTPAQRLITQEDEIALLSKTEVKHTRPSNETLVERYLTELREKGYTEAEVENARKDIAAKGISQDFAEVMDQLLIDGKISPTGGQFYASTIDAYSFWNKPSDNGRSMIPTLMIIGEDDFLLKEHPKARDLLEDYFSSLENVTPKMYGVRETNKGKYQVVDHMIFDHFRPGTQIPETYEDIIEFIEKTSHIKLQKNKTKNKEPLSMRQSIQSNFVSEMANVLAFRSFIENYTLKRKVIINKQLHTEYVSAFNSKKREIKEIKKLMSNASKEEKENFKNTINRLEDEATIISNHMSGKFVPKDNEVGKEWQAQVSRISKLESSLKKEQKEIEFLIKGGEKTNNKTGVRKKIKGKHSVFKTQTQKLNNEISKKTWEKYDADLIPIYEKLSKVYKEMGEEQTEHIYKHMKNGTTDPNELMPSGRYLRKIRKLEEDVYPEFVSKIKELDETRLQDILDGIYGEKLQELYFLKIKSEYDYKFNINRLAEIENELQKFSIEKQNYIDLILTTFNSEVYQIDEIKILDMLNDRNMTWNDLVPVVSEYWKVWKALWKNRTVVENISPY